MNKFEGLQKCMAQLEQAQARIRGYLARRNLKHQSRVATCVQTWWRCFHQKASFAKHLVAVLVLQATFRAWTLRQHYLQYKLRARQIQSAWRCHQQRVQFVEVRMSIVATQAVVRRHLASMQHRFLRQSCLEVKLAQSAARRWLARKRLKHQAQAATIIQNQWRAFGVRMRFQQMRQACIIIQCFGIQIMLRQQRQWDASTKLANAWRLYKERISSSLAKESLVTIQSVVRRHLAMKKFEGLQKCMTQLELAQAHIRGYLARRNLKHHSTASTLVQTWWRCYHLKSSFAKHLAAAHVLQATFRAWALRQQYLHYRLRARQIQSAWRCHQQRLQFVKVRTCIVTIQSVVRRHLAMNKFEGLQKCMAQLEQAQARIRGYLARRKLKQLYGAATIIQIQWRGYHCMSTFDFQRMSVILVQASIRGWMLKRLLLKVKTGVQQVQSAWRCRQARIKFANTRKRVIAIQSDVRRQSAKKHRHRRQQASVQLPFAQAAVRGWLVRRFYIHQSTAAAAVQTWWRCYHCKSSFAMKMHAVILLQTSLRGWIFRQQFRVNKERSHHKESYQKHTWFALDKKPSAAFQNAAEWHCSHRPTLQLQFAQAAIRGWLIRQRFIHQSRAATIVQTKWRGLHCKSILLESRTHYMGSKGDHKLSKHKEEVVLQKNASSCPSDQEALDRFCDSHLEVCATITIQTCWRAYQCKARFTKVRRAVKLIQRRFAIAEKQQRQRVAALTIQRGFITWKMETSFFAVQSSLILMKRSCNGQLPNSAAYFAIYQVNRELRSALISSRINSSLNGNWERAVVICEHYASILLQRALKKLLLMKRALNHWRSLPNQNRISQEAVIASVGNDVQLTSWLLMFQVRALLEEQLTAAVTIQRWIKRGSRFKQIPTWRKFVHGMILFQSYRRRQMAIKQLLVLQAERSRRAVVTIQCHVRVWLARTTFCLMLEGLQRHRAADRCRRIRLELEAALLERVFKSVSSRAKLEVEHLMSIDVENAECSTTGICLHRLAKRVVLGRIKNAPHEVERLCKPGIGWGGNT